MRQSALRQERSTGSRAPVFVQWPDWKLNKIDAHALFAGGQGAKRAAAHSSNISSRN
jgi:hypothetical protein